MANFQFPITPPVEPAKVAPFELPKIPDASALIMQAAELQGKRREREMATLKNFTDMIQNLGELSEKRRDRAEKDAQVKFLNELRTKEDARQEKELSFLTGKTSPMPPEASRFYAFMEEGVRNIGQLQSLIKKNPNIVKVATTFAAGKEIPIIGPTAVAGAEATLAGPASQKFNALNKILIDPEIRAKTGAALNREEWEFYETFRLGFWDVPETIEFKLERFRKLFETVNQQLKSGTRIPGNSPGEGQTRESITPILKGISGESPTVKSIPDRYKELKTLGMSEEQSKKRLLQEVKQGLVK